ncbi:hypothetical protein J6590_015031 [Homalodisca vitripennis]|nr:hypothetical protein J6590_015031 [Homalodisca vitripennis]
MDQEAMDHVTNLYSGLCSTKATYGEEVIDRLQSNHDLSDEVETLSTLYLLCTAAWPSTEATRRVVLSATRLRSRVMQRSTQYTAGLVHGEECGTAVETDLGETEEDHHADSGTPVPPDFNRGTGSGHQVSPGRVETSGVKSQTMTDISRLRGEPKCRDPPRTISPHQLLSTAAGLKPPPTFCPQLTHNRQHRLWTFIGDR